MNDLLRATEATKHSLLFQSLVIKRSSRMFLVRLLQEQFERTGSIDIINLAIALNEEVLVATPHTDKYFTKCLANLAVALKMRFDIVGSSDDINRSLDLYQHVIQSYNKKPLSESYYNRLTELWKSPAAAELTNDVDLAVASYKTAILSLNEIHPYSDPGAPIYLEFSELVLRSNFAKTGSPENLHQIVRLWEDAAVSTPQSHMNYSRYLRSLSNALLFRFTELGKLDDLGQALSLSEQALGFANQHGVEERGDYFWVFAVAMLSKFRITDCRSDIETAVMLLRAAEKTNNPYSLMRRRVRADQALALKERCERTGSTDDIDQSIAISSELIKATSQSDPARMFYLKDLSRSLYQRYKQIGSAADDLHQSILNAKMATELLSLNLLPFLTDLRDEHRISADDLSLTLLARFRRTGCSDDLNNAFQLAIQAEGSGHTSTNLSLAEVFISWFDETDSINHLNEAIAICSTTQLFLDRARGRRVFVRSSTILTSALIKRYNKTGSMKDINLAIETMRSALSSEPEDHPERATHLDIIGNCFHTRFIRTGAIDDLHSAIEAKEQAFSLSVAPPIVRLKAAQLLSSLLLKEDRSRAKELLKRCVQLLPSISSRMLKRSDQQYNISQVADLTSRTVSLCLELGDDPYDALSILEMGRGFIANLQLEVRSDVSDLEIRHSELGKRFVELRRKLNLPDAESSFSDVEDRRNVAKEFEKMLSHIRDREGFERFLLSPSESELQRLAVDGPIVVFNVSETRSDAILITLGRIKFIQLPRLTYAELEKHYQLFMDAVSLSKTSRYSLSGRTKMTKVLEWLWDSGVESILDELQFTEAVPDCGVWPRVWWIGSGLLNLLPIHAAGYHDSGIRNQKCVGPRSIVLLP